MSIKAGNRARRILSLLLMFLMLFGQMDMTPFAESFAVAAEVTTESPAPTATPTATAEPTATATPVPTATPTAEPTATPTAEPTATPTVEPTATATAEPTATATPVPAPTSTAEPTATPTAEPSATPTAEPSATPTAEPSASPTPGASGEPTPEPSEDPLGGESPMLAMGLFGALETVPFTNGYDASLDASVRNQGMELPYLYASAVVSRASVPTGEAFTYTIVVSTQGAPAYKVETQTFQAYEQYKNITVKITVPDGIDLYRGSDKLIPVDGIVTLTGFTDVDTGRYMDFTLTGKMTGNGSVPNETPYKELEIHVSATVDTTDSEGAPQSVDFDFDLVEDPDSKFYKNVTDIMNVADVSWHLTKVAKEPKNPYVPTISTIGGVECATFTYYIKTGLTDAGENFLTQASPYYDKFGVINFSEYTLTDTLPTFENAAGVSVAPISSSITLLTPTNATGTTSATGGAGETSLTVTGYNRTALTGQHAGADAAMTPFYSEYEVKVSYPLSDLTLPYGSDKENQEGVFRLTNSASLSFKYVGTTDPRVLNGSDYIDYQKKTPAGGLKIQKNISFLNSPASSQPYNEPWSTLFPGGADFGVTLASNWNGTAPIINDAAHVTTYSLTTNDTAPTIPLGPGDYVVFETDPPYNTTAAPAQPVTIASGENKTLTFTNSSAKGMLTFQKVNEGTTPLSGATFELRQGEVAKAEGTSDSQGFVYILADPGEYTLVETVAPTGRLKIADRLVNIVNAQTLNLGQIHNYPSTAKLTITKYVVSSAVGGDKYSVVAVGRPSGVESSDFSFKLTWPKNPDNPSILEETGVKTLDSSGKVEFDGLSRAYDNGQWITYTLVETTDGAYAQQVPITITFDSSTNRTLDVNNILLSKLKIKKMAKTFNASGSESTSAYFGAKFKVYTKSGTTYTQVGGYMTDLNNGSYSTGYLPIRDAAGALIDYYIVEDPVAGYTVNFPVNTSISLDGGSTNVSAWKVNLSYKKETDLTGQVIYNNRHKGKIVFTKTDTAGIGLNGAQYKVYYYDSVSGTMTYFNGGAIYTTSGTGTNKGKFTVSPVDLNVTYYFEEITPPADYLTATGSDPSATVTTVLGSVDVSEKDPKKPELRLYKNMVSLVGDDVTYQAGIPFTLYTKSGSTFTEVNPEVKVLSGSSSAYVSKLLPGTGPYYLKEGFPDNVVKPFVEDNMYPQGTDTVVGYIKSGSDYFYGPISFEADDYKEVTLDNYLNRGNLTVTKKDAKTNPQATVSGAVTKFKVSVTYASGDTISGLPTSFTPDGTRTYSAIVDTVIGVATLTGLPIYSKNGVELVYTITEAQPPEGYLGTSDSQTAQFGKVGFPSGGNRVVAKTFSNIPEATLNIHKVKVDKYGQQHGHEVRLPLEGVSIELYKKTVAGGSIRLAYVASISTDSNGWVSFEGLDGMGDYVAFERTPPPGLELPTGKEDTPTQSYLTTTDFSPSDYEGFATKYNAVRFNFGESSTTPNEHSHASLVNEKPYVQFRLIKRGSETGAPLLDHAKYALYKGADFATAVLIGTYETGTARDSGGVAIPGEFLTEPLEYGATYWLKEVQPPDGYKIPEGQTGIIGPLTPSGADKYNKNSITLVEAVNELDQTGPGGDGPRYLQIQIKKKLHTTEGTYVNLAGVTFDVYLGDGNGTPVGAKLTSMTTGVDMRDSYTPTQNAEVAGNVLSESFNMTALSENPTYAPYIKAEVDSVTGVTTYTAQFVLKEVRYPADVTPTQTYWTLTATTSADVDVVYTINTHYFEYPILNEQVAKVPVVVRKMGYNLASSTVLTPRGGFKFKLYKGSSASGELQGEYTTDATGYIHLMLEPNTQYFLQETWAGEGYEKNPTYPLNKNPFWTGVYGSDAVEIEVKDPQYRKLVIVKKNTAGLAVEGAVFRITTPTGGQIKDSNGQNIANDTITTNADGIATIWLPAGKYRVNEIKIGDYTLTQLERDNFLVANPGINPVDMTGSSGWETVAGVATYTKNVVNHDLGKLIVLKTDNNDDDPGDIPAPIANVQFTLQFKQFAQGDTAANATYPPVTDTGFGAVIASYTALTDATGRIEWENLTPGWYKLTEKNIPADYVGAGTDSARVVKVTANGIGQTNGDAVTVTVRNDRKGTLEIRKQFPEGFAGIPQSGKVTFYIYKNAGGTNPASPASVDVPISGNAGSVQVRLDPGTYYIKEGAHPQWYSRYRIGTRNSEGVLGFTDYAWLGDGTTQAVTIVGDDTAELPVVLDVDNLPTQATVVVKKIDDAGQAIKGVEFGIFLDSAGTQPLGNSVLTGDDGTATLTVTLPWTRVSANQTDYYLRELSAPPEYELLTEPIQLTLTPGALVSWEDAELHPELTVENVTAIKIDLIKYARTHANIEADPAHVAPVLANAEFKLYRVNTSAAPATLTLVQTGTTGADGKLTFGNLPKLTGDEAYYVYESGTPDGYVPGSLEVYDEGGSLSQSGVFEVGGKSVTMYRVAKDSSASVSGYNKRLGGIAILKYNYTDPTSPAVGVVPYYARFSLVGMGTSLTELRVDPYNTNKPDSLAGGAYVPADNYYKDANGYYYSSVIVRNLLPGSYNIAELEAAQGFLLPEGTTDDEPWDITKSATVEDDGEIVVVRFANVKEVTLKPGVNKSVDAVRFNGAEGDLANQPIEANLQNGPLDVTFRIEDAASTAEKPFKLPVDKLTVEDRTLSFKGKDGVAIPSGHVNYIVTRLVVGEASYPTEIPGGVTATVYGIDAGGEHSVGSFEVKGAEELARTFNFGLSSTYTGFKVVYTATASGAKLEPGFTVGDFLVDIRFTQPDSTGETLIKLVREISNTAKSTVEYKLGSKTFTAESTATAGLTIDPSEALPKAKLTKTVQAMNIKGTATIGEPGTDTDPISVKPGAYVFYTLKMENTSDLPIEDPVIVDEVPAMLSVDLNDVGFTGGGLTSDGTGSYTDPVSHKYYIFRNFEGILAPGESVIVTFRATVRNNVVIDDVDSVLNIAYASSTKKIMKNEENQFGTSFKAEGGGWPAIPLDGKVLGGIQGETYQALEAEVPVYLMVENGVNIYKFVAADATGMGNFVSGAEYAVANVSDPDDQSGSNRLGRIQYKIVLVNNGTNPVTHLRVVDRLPVLGDQDVQGNSDRYSKWAPYYIAGSVRASYSADGEDTGSVTPAPTVYSTHDDKSNSDYRDSVIPESAITGWSGDSDGARGILIDFSDPSFKLDPGVTLVITFEATSPSTDAPDLQDYFFENAVNTALTGYKNGVLEGYSASPYAKVILTPETVGVGNRVWIDENADGLQDGGNIDSSTGPHSEPSYTGRGIKVRIRRFFNSDTNSQASDWVEIGADGFYKFDGLTPATTDPSKPDADYDSAGNIINGQLKGVGRTSYQLEVTDVPAGYIVVPSYRGNGANGYLPPNYDSGDGRSTDSNFKPGENGVYTSERFYLQPGQDDLTYDLGLIRVRDLEIVKEGEKDGGNALLKDVVFKVYGPFTNAQLDAGATVSEANRVTTLDGTTAGGKTTFTSVAGTFLNYYANYVVVETTSASPYIADGLTATGRAGTNTNIGSADDYTVTGAPIQNGNYFVLKARTSTSDSISLRAKDCVDVLNEYRATGEIVLGGTKKMTGRNLPLAAGEFSFELRDSQENLVGTSVGNAAGSAVTGGVSTASLSFPKLTFTEAQLGDHSYTIREVLPGPLPTFYDYDAKIYTVVVKVDDDAHSGTLGVSIKSVTYTDAAHQQPKPADGAVFTNAYTGQAKVILGGTKTMTGRQYAADEFTFRLYSGTDTTIEANLIEEVSNLAPSSGGVSTFAFAALDYSGLDINRSYTYTIVEVPGGVGLHTYDTTEYTVTVTIGYDVETGVLTPTVVVKNGTETVPVTAVPTTSDDGKVKTIAVSGIPFENTYNASAKVVLKGTKQLLGHDLANEQFTFKLYSGTDTSETAIPLQTVKNAVADSTGRKAGFEFAPILYDGFDIGGEFTYTLVEVNEAAPGYTYDAAKYTVTVRIDYDIASGVMTPVVEVKKGTDTVAVTTDTQTSLDGNIKTVTIGAIPFENEYWAEGTYTPVGSKALVDRELQDGLFRFEVLDGSDVVSRGESKADGSIVFDAITYHKNKNVDDTAAPHTYTVREITGNDEGWDDTGIVYSTETYTLTVTVTDNDDGTLSATGLYARNDAQGDPTSEIGELAAFHNTTQKVRFAVKKVWQDDAPYPHRPVEITVYLVGKAGDTIVVDLSHTFGGTGNEWSYTFPDVPRYDYTDPTNSVLIAYTITEKIVTGYSTVILEKSSSNDGQLFEVNYEITNALRKFTVSKRSSGGGRLAGATLSLYKVVGSTRTLFDRWTTVSGKDYVVTGLEPGVYRLIETAVPADHVAAADIIINVALDGTITSSEMNASGVVVMVDPLIPRQNVTGTKTWIDLSNEKGNRPENITLTLYADEVPVVATPTWVKNGDVWTYTYENLLIYRVGNSGEKIVYRVEEEPVKGYKPTYNGLDIVNEPTEVEIEYTSVSGTKTWVDDDDAAGVRPDSITVYLLQNGSVYKTKVVTEADGWAYSFKNLPESDGLTTRYTYSISEKMVPGYVRLVNGSNLTNTYVPPEEPPRPPQKPPYTPENWENLITLLDEEVPLYGGLLKTGEEVLTYPFVFAGIGLLAAMALVLDRRKRKSRGK